MTAEAFRRAVLVSIFAPPGCPAENPAAMNRTDTLKGTVCAVLSSATFGFAPFFTLSLLGFGLSAFEVLFYRWGVAAVALGLFGVLGRADFRIGGRDALTIIGLGILRAATSLSLVSAYRLMATGAASAIHFLYPLAVTCAMALFFGERIGWRTVLAVVVSLLGAALLSLGGGQFGSVDLRGVGWAFLSVLSYGGYIVGVRKTRAARIDSSVLTFYVTLFGAVMFAASAFLSDGGITVVSDPVEWLYVLGLALPATAVSNITLVHAIKYIGPTLTSLFGAMEPLTAMVVGICAFGENFTLRTAIGMALVIAAVSSVILRGGKREADV